MGFVLAPSSLSYEILSVSKSMISAVFQLSANLVDAEHLPEVYFNEELFEGDIALTTRRNEAKMPGTEAGVNILIQAAVKHKAIIPRRDHGVKF